MNDPWNVKSVRQPGQYQSCMKIHGVPLLPPVLSKECRKEMQYYKMLAKEVEKRISMLRPYIDSDVVNDANDGPCTPESYDSKDEKTKKQSPKNTTKDIEKIRMKSDAHSRNFVIDLSLRINHTENNDVEGSSSDSGESQMSLLPIELPERDFSPKVKEKEEDLEKPRDKQDLEKELLAELLNDYHYPNLEKRLLLDENICSKLQKEKELILEKAVASQIEAITAIPVNKDLIKETINFKFGLNKDSISDAFLDLMRLDGPSSVSTKSFTGSLLDIHSESVKDNDMAPKLVRQRSYTVLTPSPQLMAHLELQSLNKGVDLNTISMSESQTSPNCKKRRSWDLETAKMKWSSMALELKQNNVATIKISNGTTNNNVTNRNSRNPTKPKNASPYYRSQSVAQDRRRGSLNKVTKSDPIPKHKTPNALKKVPSDKTVTKEVLSSANKTMMKDRIIQNYTTPKTVPLDPVALISEPENPALKVKELYENIQQQQFIQMTTLIEKQKREQQILHQVFEEQNNILFKQLKMICPKSPIEIRQAWGDKQEEGDNSGPVSLSQLNHIPKALPPSVSESPVSKTLTETNQYINHCNDVLKKSRDIRDTKKPQSIKRALTNVTNSIKSALSNSRNSSPSYKRQNSPEGRKNRSRSPTNRNTSRKLNYESASDYEPMLTDRTNDTFADLNVTFPSDTEESVISQYGSNGMELKDMTVIRQSPAMAVRNGTDAALRSLEDSIRNSSKTMYAKKAIPPTQKELEAASKIVAYAKGYLCRRLMRTDRVQSTVQTIRDALLCALQLHQDREGIRGADVDLHRRLIQQITAACYSLHDTFIASTSAERCAMIASDRARRRVSAARQSPDTRSFRQTSDAMSRSHSGVFRSKRPSSAATLMTRSNYETFSGSTVQPSPRRRPRPWR